MTVFRVGELVNVLDADDVYRVDNIFSVADLSYVRPEDGSLVKQDDPVPLRLLRKRGCVPSSDGRRCVTHHLLPLYPDGQCMEART